DALPLSLPSIESPAPDREVQSCQISCHFRPNRDRSDLPAVFQSAKSDIAKRGGSCVAGLQPATGQHQFRCRCQARIPTPNNVTAVSGSTYQVMACWKVSKPGVLVATTIRCKV